MDRHQVAGDAIYTELTTLKTVTWQATQTQGLMKKFEFNHKFERENAAFLWLFYVDGIKCELR